MSESGRALGHKTAETRKSRRTESLFSHRWQPRTDAVDGFICGECRVQISAAEYASLRYGGTPALCERRTSPRRIEIPNGMDPDDKVGYGTY